MYAARSAAHETHRRFPARPESQDRKSRARRPARDPAVDRMSSSPRRAECPSARCKRSATWCRAEAPNNRLRQGQGARNRRRDRHCPDARTAADPRRHCGPGLPWPQAAAKTPSAATHCSTAPARSTASEGPRRFARPACRRMAVIHMRRGPEESFLAQFALIGAGREIGMRLARCNAFHARKRDVFRHSGDPLIGGNASMDNAIIGENCVWWKRLPLAQSFIKRSEWLVCFGEQLFETVDDEIARLIGVDPEFGGEHAFQIEGDAVRGLAFDRVNRFAMRRKNTSPIRTQALPG